MFNTVLIANRGAIATRIIRSLKKLGVQSVAVYHQADRQSLHVQHADHAICLGEGSAADTYLDIDKIIAAAKQSGAEAIHPGYGFLSENTEFVQRCEQAGLVFIGPSSEQINLFGLKHQAREAAELAGVPLVPGSGLLHDLDSALSFAESIGYPIMLKSTAGGGGIGMQVCTSHEQLQSAWLSVKRLSQNFFKNDGVFIEKYIAQARHIEVQILGDGHGTAVSFGERDCSAQRRNQKVIEETPAPNLTEQLRNELCLTAERLMSSVNYRNAGTVEFIFDQTAQQFYFLEVNTRLQVEHGVTEEVWGIDLVEHMLHIASDQPTDLKQLKASCHAKGHAIQVRVYAEDAQLDFRPSAGLLSKVQLPEDNGLRIDTWVESGVEVSALFDPMIAKIICHAKDRTSALEKLQKNLAHSEFYGIETNSSYVQQILRSDTAKQGMLLTSSLASFTCQSDAVRIESSGTLTTIQDFPGRSGLWHVGVPPSGAMDNVALRLANHLVNNHSDAAVLEITLNGPSLRFLNNSAIAISGAEIEAELDGQPLAMHQCHHINAGQLLKLGKINGAGARSYLAIAGGIQCPAYLGSRSTFTLGQFGGHNGRALKTGDVLHLDTPASLPKVNAITKTNQPNINELWHIRVIYGPHGAPDFFTENDINEFFEHQWEVHYNSSRTGVRLIGPKPKWARQTGGEAGLHPSNIHDNAYAFGSVDFTGDMPVILGPDGPSLGGFVCPATVIQADLWKLGQLKSGAKIQFIPVSIADAVAAEAKQLKAITLGQFVEHELKENRVDPIIHQGLYQKEPLHIRCAGDHFVLAELGPLELDIERRFKIHALMLKLEEARIAGLKEFTPGIRSLQVHFDSQQISAAQVCTLIQHAASELEQNSEHKVPTRTVYLPLSWDDIACREAIKKYTQSVRPGAPWCPSNLEFIRRINGLTDLSEVKDIVFNASYLVMGLGDVYLGAPVATPIDPRHRLVTTKYNPARTWTAENSVGIGGAYMCVYGMEGPGGYQFVGRTLQMWNRYRQTEVFNQPWLLRFFDQIRFYEVSHDELQQIREDFPLGKFPLRIEHGEFDLADYKALLKNNSEDIKRFQTTREAAFAEELEQWRLDGQITYEAAESAFGEQADEHVPDSCQAIESPVSGTIWQVQVDTLQQVKEGDLLLILESMKMEIEIYAPCNGRIKKIFKSQGNAVLTGQSLLWIEAE